MSTFSIIPNVKAGAILLAVSLLLIIAFSTTKYLRDPLRQIPGPFYSKWTNLVLKLKVLQGCRTPYIHNLHGVYGDIVRIGPNEISIASLKGHKTIHKSGSGYNKSGWYKAFVGKPTVGIFAETDPKVHLQLRRLFSQAFSNTSIIKYDPVIRGLVDLMVSRIKEDIDHHGEADLFKWFTFFAMDVSGKLGFGKSFEMLKSGQKNQYIKDVETVLMLSGIKVELPIVFTLSNYLPFSFAKQLSELHKRLKQYGTALIRHHEEVLAENKDPMPTFFDKFIGQGGSSGQLTQDQITDEAMNLIVAGSDTTAVTLTYTVWLVLHKKHRAIKQKLLAELGPVPSDIPGVQTLSLPYLQAVIKEGLRLYGAAPGSLPRIVPSTEFFVDSGYTIPPGTTVCTQSYTLHRNPAIFPDPEKFDPDRWLDPTQQMKDAFNAFGAGSRVCLGIHLAMLELSTAAFVFFKSLPNASLAASTTDESMEIADYFVISPKSHHCNVTIVK